MLHRSLAFPLLFVATSLPALATNIRFEAWGTVASAGGVTGAYAGIAAGQPAHLVFEVLTPGTDVTPGHVTDYAIAPATLQLTMGPVTVGVSGGTPTATMRNADPIADGVLASATLTSSKNLDFSFTDCNGAMFTSSDATQNLGSWSGGFYCVYGFTVWGSGTFIDIDLTAFAISELFVGQPLCFGDGTQAVPCPCANNGLVGRGCENSAGTGGAKLSALGTLVPDALVLTSSGELPSVLSIFLQGNQQTVNPLVFGDGLRCAGGALKRLYVKSASGGVVSAPGAGDLPVTAQSAALGDPIASGSTRWYQVYYRDANAGFCPQPQGNTWNVSSALAIGW